MGTNGNRLQARGLACRRGAALLFAGLDVNLEAGSALWVTGANGSGKTSLLRILAGLALPAAGEVLWNDSAPHSVEYRAAMIYVGHVAPLKEDLTVDECLAEMLGFDGISVSKVRRHDALEAVNLARRGKLATRYLSLGQKRRLVLARLALAGRALWILDEPANGLDREGQTILEARASAHLAAGGMLLFSSHQELALDAAVTGLTL